MKDPALLFFAHSQLANRSAPGPATPAQFC